MENSYAAISVTGQIHLFWHQIQCMQRWGFESTATAVMNMHIISILLCGIHLLAHCSYSLELSIIDNGSMSKIVSVHNTSDLQFIEIFGTKEIYGFDE